MKPLKNKITKNLIIILSITAILSGVLPNYVYAETDTEEGGGLLAPMEKFCVFVCDNVMQWLQEHLKSTEEIDQGDGTYKFQYSPGIIFSGTIPAFDINFIDPEGAQGSYVQSEELENIDINNPKQYIEENKEKKYVLLALKAENEKTEEEYTEKLNNIKSMNVDKVTGESGSFAINPYIVQKYEIFYYINENGTKNVEDDLLVTEIFAKSQKTIAGKPSYYYYKLEENLYSLTGTYESTASKLQTTLATWYVALRRIALVGLLSVLVYVGIRIVISSAASEKAKYKGMLKDWLVAVCLLFTLHYIMSITITVTNEVSQMFSPGQSDELLNTLRQDIHLGSSWGAVLAKTIMYVFLVMQTVMFSVKYLKRVIYMAFYTLIAPLITLTYPLDKIKDGQAQAFNMWLKEYIFTALIQVVHLVIYFVLVSSAIGLVADYPLYAIIVISFISKAEDLIKKMFGFNQAETLGTLGDAAAGGLIMSTIKSLKPPAKGKEEGEGEGEGNKPVRTATNPNPMAPLTGGKVPPPPTPPSPTPRTPPPSSPPPPAKGNFIKGVKSLAGKYTKPVAEGTLGVFGAGVGGIVGFSRGLLKGDLTDAVTAGILGVGIGKNVAGWGIDKVEKITDIKGHVEKIEDTYDKIVHGKKGAETRKFDRKFFKSDDYKKLKAKYGSGIKKEDVQAMLDAGMSDEKTMEKVFDGIGQEDVRDLDDAIAYYTLAQRCPDSIYYGDDSDLEEYLTHLGVTTTDAIIMRRNMRLFRD